MIELQTNELSIEDFGQFYNQPRIEGRSQLKRVLNFVTNNRHPCRSPHRPHPYARAAVPAASSRLRPSGRPRKRHHRELAAITEKIIRLLDEAKGGIAGHGASLTIGNFIIESGVMGYVRKAVDGSGGRVRFIPIVDRQGVSLLARQIRQNRRRSRRR